MNKGLVLFLCLFLAMPSAVFAQVKQEKPEKQKSVSQIPRTDPFQIGKGKFFSASTKSAPPQSSFEPAQTSSDEISEDFAEALDIIRKNHVSGKKLDFNEVTKSSVTAMLRTLDPHSNYFDTREYEELLTDQQSEYYGIGATIVNYERGGEVETYVVSTFPESAASRANLRYGDKIVAVNGEKMTDKDSEYVRDKVRGKLGSTVRIQFERADTKRLETIELKRTRVPQPSIPDAYLLRRDVGYVDMTEGFNYTTAEELTVALRELREQGMKTLILDLRNNPGGILEQAVKVAERFLPEGSTVVTQRGRFRIDNRTWKSTNRNAETMPMVVLVDGGSASASEIVAGALQDFDRAFIIGEKTFGKGLVQSIFNLPYSSGLTLTTAKYYTPSGRSIQRDYSKGNLYDYFNHKEDATAQTGQNHPVSYTMIGRKVYGGDGIMPDEVVKEKNLSQLEANLLDPLFFFSRELVHGRVKGFENYKMSGQVRYGERIQPSDSPVTDELISAFKAFAVKEKLVTAEKLDNENSFIKTRLRFNLIMAAFGSVSANQVLIEDDPQVSKAVEALPRAEQLALSAKKANRKQYH
ncbi:MAG: S41 family peptidase [Pyrinomonadaceae bacterium]|nr:S41 family peptidase [Pyrinomonadaceae bacterium]